MNRQWSHVVAMSALALSAQCAMADNMTGCPAGQAMQSSDPSGKKITCVPIPNTAALQQQIDAEKAAREAQDANLGAMLGAESAARQVADNALGARVDALTEADLIGRWTVSGETGCLQSTSGFNSFFSPNIIPNQTVVVSHLTASSMGTRTFTADGRGTSDGKTFALSFPGTVFGPPPVNLSAGGASVAGISGGFSWHIDPTDGMLHIQDDFPLAQPFLEPATRLGWTATIDKLPEFVGHISKDKKTIVMSHPGMVIETSTTRDQNGNFIGSSQRFCTRGRILTRLPN